MIVLPYSLAFGRPHGQHAGNHGLAVEQHRARPALAFAASVFHASEANIFPQHLQQRPLGIAGHAARLSVHAETKYRHDEYSAIQSCQIGRGKNRVGCPVQPDHL
jgi:hypothetical protein